MPPAKGSNDAGQGAQSTAPNAGGRPKKGIDQKQVESLAAIQCTFEEIALVVGCSKKTLQRRFAKVIEAARKTGRASLRRVQWDAAMNGNITMQIWLGKQILKQSDDPQRKKPKPSDFVEVDQALATAEAPPGAIPPVPRPDAVQDLHGGPAERQDGAGEA